ncbi:hypothetical protein K470DRAFT_257997 [Piedraia hortae CBS 480.64]|uniref:Uncharacterized protein n=1 Tax=Piedraia hortae CBS 480.64 TaxID=1314780 RepID=A0A6A7C083_9PEZI|nr:hypothetical protein K470DRAFT_257997 [Piedraia hortae CBS 480.64]
MSATHHCPSRRQSNAKDLDFDQEFRQAFPQGTRKQYPHKEVSRSYQFVTELRGKGSISPNNEDNPNCYLLGS